MATAAPKKTRRAQVQATPVLRNQDELSDALRELCDISARNSAREAEMNQAITEIREQANNDMADDKAMDARLRKDVEEYCTYHRATMFTNRKSVEFAHGTVDFRQHPPAVTVSKKLKMTIGGVMENIRQMFGKKSDDYIRTKPELNKDALITLEESTLEQLGLEIQRKETFGISLKLDELAPPSTATSRQ